METNRLDAIVMTNTPNGIYYVNVIANGTHTDKAKIVINK